MSSLGLVGSGTHLDLGLVLLSVWVLEVLVLIPTLVQSMRQPLDQSRTSDL